MTNIILCGGSGTRLWPLSRKLLPKQFLKLFDDKSLFQLTLQRNSKMCDKTLIVSNEEQYFLALDQIEELNSQFSITNSQFLLEPIGKNTAPAIALACMDLPKDEIVLITPSDHLIKNQSNYQKVLQDAQQTAQKDYLVTFGITPTYPETGFGYIEYRVENLEFKSEAFNVNAFCEKPDINTAKKYLENNSKTSNLNPKSYYLWNSGMFMFKAGVFLDELKTHSPKIYKTCIKAYQNSKKDNSIIRIKQDDMLNIPEDSIDYAVMEKSKRVKVIPSDISWSDVGNFDALIKEDLGLRDKNLDNYFEIDSKDNFYYSDTKDKVIATIGLKDFIVIDTKDALLISKKDQTQKVKDLVSKLKEQNSELLQRHHKVYRPWGSYEVLIDTHGYKLKKIIVQPKKRLSLQKHFHRNEHWVVVSGTATVRVGDETKLIGANESTYIKMGEIHRLSNEGKIPVVLIEAQVGEYTGEDDIVRIDDDYERD